MAQQSNPQPASAVTACDGQVLKQLAAAGLAWLERNYEQVNALNVFPVPDGDTGTNMLLTMRSAYKEIAGSDETHLGRMAQRIYNGALMGARGNSGVILSQLWRGFARGVESEAQLSVAALTRGLREATQTADKAVQEPVDGTILTVARDVADEAEAAAAEGKLLPEILQRVVARSHWSVERTPQLLRVLREAGVVDAGGMGLAFILEGMLRYMNGEPVELTQEEAAKSSAVSGEIDLSGLEWPYDVQFLIVGENLSLDDIRDSIERMGDSALIVGDASLVKVHVHVVNPGDPLGYAAQLGQLDDIVVENMMLQYQKFAGEKAASMSQPASVRMPEVTPGSIAVVTVAPGDGLTNILYSLGAAYVVAGGQTMNPSTEQFVEAIEQLPTNMVIILPNNKNIFLAAEQATRMVNGKVAEVVPTTTIPQGISALLALDPDGEMETVIEAMRESSKLVETGEITRATRNVTFEGVKVNQGQLIGLHNDVLKVAGDDITGVTLDLLEVMRAGEMELITLYSGVDVTAEEAEVLAERLRQTYPKHEIEVREGGQPHYYYILSVE